jgi:hypothetical protein
MVMEHVDPERAGRPPGYDAVSETIAAEKEHALAAFRRSSFEQRLLERIEHPRSSRLAPFGLVLAGALAIVLGVVLLTRTTARFEGLGLKTATVERALWSAPLFAGTPAPSALAEADPRRAELAWSIERIVASIQRERVKERDLQRVVEKALAAAAGGAVLPATDDPWQQAQTAGLQERLERLRRERSVERLLAAYNRVG